MGERIPGEIPDVVVLDCDDAADQADEEPERRLSQAQLIPVEKTRSEHSESDCDQNLYPMLDALSQQSLPSLVSTHDVAVNEHIKEVALKYFTMVTSCIFCVLAQC